MENIVLCILKKMHLSYLSERKCVIYFPIENWSHFSERKKFVFLKESKSWISEGKLLIYFSMKIWQTSHTIYTMYRVHQKKYTSLSRYCELWDLNFLFILFLSQRGCFNLNFELTYINFKKVVRKKFTKN